MRRLLYLFIAFTPWACAQSPSEGELIREARVDSIQELEIRIQSSGEALKPIEGLELKDRLVRYSREYPQDSLSPYYLLKAGNVARNLPDGGSEAIRFYEETYGKYPDHPVAAPALFFRALTYDEVLRNREMAASTMNEFLERFPDHRLAAQGIELLRIYQDTIDEIDQVKEWLEKADTTSTQEP